MTDTNIQYYITFSFIAYAFEKLAMTFVIGKHFQPSFRVRVEPTEVEVSILLLALLD
jgi:hypothetical protein